MQTRIYPEDVTINIGVKDKVPEPPAGHKWKEIVHHNDSMWLAMWREPIMDRYKYVWLHTASSLKGQNDMKKYEKARKLKKKIGSIRKEYMKALTSADAKDKQLATAIYLIDKLALRVGNEKGDDEADTVGCCSLRVEHIKLRNTEQEPYTIDFDFLGKDSMRYQNTVQIEPKAWKAIESFCKGKRKSEELFDKISVGALNTYLKKFMPELSAKVFRTYNASITLQQELAKLPEDFDRLSVDQKLLFYNRANRQVAILCNHQRTVKQTTFSAGMGKFKLALKENIDEYHRIKKHLRRLTTSKKYADSSDDMELDFSSDDEEIKQYKIAQEEREEFKKKQAALEEAAAKKLKEEKWDDESDDKSADSDSDDGKDKKKVNKEVKKEKCVKRAPQHSPTTPTSV